MDADELSFPTAIVPARPAGTSVERARKYMRAFGDPMGVLFMDMKTATRKEFQGDGVTVEVPDREVRRECAKELMPYVYPKLRASEVAVGVGVGAGGAVPSITINIGFAPPRPQPPPQDPVAAAIDVTPTSPADIDPLA